MHESANLTIGTDVVCEDGVAGELKRVVVNPVARAITHLVVEPKHGHSGGYLVPIEHIEVDGNILRLDGNIDDLGRFQSAEEFRVLPTTDEQFGYRPEEIATLPYYGLGTGSLGLVGAGLGGGGLGAFGAITPSVDRVVSYDRIPLGEVEVRRGDRVHAADGDIGRVRGLVIDPEDYHVTHILLEEGHLWGRREIAIPITTVGDLDDEGAHLSISKAEVEALPPIEIDQSERLADSSTV